MTLSDGLLHPADPPGDPPGDQLSSCDVDVPSARPGQRDAESAALVAWMGSHPRGPGVDRARERLVLVNMPVAHGVAWRYRDRGIEVEDLRQVACTALVRAARTFDGGRGHEFLTYAVPCMRGEVKRHFRDVGWTVRPPRRIQELQASINAHTHDLVDGSEQHLHELAEATGSATWEVGEALQAQGCFTPTSLDAPLDGATTITLGSSLAASDEPARDAVEARLTVGPAVRLLDERDQLILQLRYGEGLTQAEMGERLGVAQVSVSRYLARIHAALKDTLDGPGASGEPTRATLAGAGGSRRG